MEFSKCFGHQKPIKEHLVRYREGGGGVGQEVADLRRDINESFVTLEKKDGYPLLKYAEVESDIDAAGGVLKITGENLIEGQTFDTYAYGAGTAELTFTALKPGKTNYSVEVVHNAGGAPDISFAAGKLTIEANVGTQTANDIATAVNAASSAASGYIRCVSGGAGTPAALTETDLSGGTTEEPYGFTATLNGAEILPYHETGNTPSQTLTDTVCYLTIGSGMVLGTIPVYTVSIETGGLLSNSLSFSIDELVTASAPTLDLLNIGGGGGAAIVAAGGNVGFVGRNILQGQTFDSLTISHDAANSMDVVALKPGVSGFSIEVVDSGGGGLAVTLAAGVIEVDLGGAGSDYNAVATAINANGAATDGYVRANVTAQDGSALPVMAETPLAGGVGAGFYCYVAGDEALPQNEPGTTSTAKISDTAVAVATPAVGNLNDQITVYIISNGVMTPVPMSTVLA